MRSWKTLLNDKRWLLLAAILAFALLASWCESRMRRGELPGVAQQKSGRDTGERSERRAGGQRQQQPRQLPDEFTGTTLPVEQLKPDPAPTHAVTLQRVRSGQHDDFDRVVFEFEGDAPPGFRVEYVDKLARKCGPDELKVLGGTWLLVRMTPAQGHVESGRTSVGNIEVDEDLSAVKFIRPVCDTDGQLEWMIEVTDRKPYRAETLTEPPRLVIDIKHQ